MTEIIFILFVLFIAIACAGIAALLIYIDKDNRKMKRIIDDQVKYVQKNTDDLALFYEQKKKLIEANNIEVAKIEALLKDERKIAALAVQNSEMLKDKIKEQQEEISQLKTDLQGLSKQLQHANESRLIEVQNERQKWTELLQGKEKLLQKLEGEASSIGPFIDTLNLISKEMQRRMDEQSSNLKLLDEKMQENLSLMAQLEQS